MCRKRILKGLCVFLMIIIACSMPVLLNINVLKAYADQQDETLEQKIERFTSSDLLDGENENGETIQTFSNKFKAGEYNVFFHDAYGFVITDIIKKVIPIELLYSIGTHVYMGKEYGIVVETKENELGDYYEAKFLLIDFSLGLEGQGQFVSESTPKYRMETILQSKVITCFENNDWVVYRAWQTEDFYLALRNSYIAVNLENENELNAYDANYDINLDRGGVIRNVSLDFSMHEYIDFYTIYEKYIWCLKNIAMKAIELTVDLLGNMGGDVIEDDLIEDIVNIMEKTNDIKDSKILDNALILHKLINGQTNLDQVLHDYIVEDYYCSPQNSSSDVATPLILTFDQKDVQKTNNQYIREVYFLQDVVENLESSIIYSGRDVNDKNDFLQLDLIAELTDVNSRYVFSSGFEVAIMTEFGTEILILNEDGEYEFVPEETGLTPALITQACDYKVVKTNNENIERIRSVNYIEDSNDDIADKPAYLLNGTGYQLYKFEPIAEAQNNEQYVFGKYRFFTRSANQSLAAIRIHIFQGDRYGVPLDIEQLCNLTQAELLEHPYLLRCNNFSVENETNSPHSVEMWSLDYNFTLNEEDSDGPQNTNTYYILYTYKFNYTGGSTVFNAEYEFVPEEISLTNGINDYYIDGNNESYFRFSPIYNDNYVINVSGYDNANIIIYKQSPGLSNKIAQKTGSFIEALMDNNHTYYICVQNNLGGASGNVSVSTGAVLNGYKTNYSAIGVNESRYYKFIPTDYTGTYKLLSNKSIHSVNCYNDSFEELVNSDGVFLSKNNVYYIEIKNIGASVISGELSIEYQYDVTCFNSKLEIRTEGYKKYYAYVIEGAEVNGLNMDVTVVFNGSIILSQSYVGEEEIVIDLTNVNFISGENSFNASIVVNGNNDFPTSVPEQVVNFNDFKLTDSSYTGEYVYINCDTVPVGSKKVSISKDTKVVVFNTSQNRTYSNISFTFDNSSEPLLIYFANEGKTLTFNAPEMTASITSNRDLIINCKGSVTFKGGDGEDKDDLYNIVGKAGLYMRNNTLFLNGNGAVNFYGGDGGDIGGDYTGGARAGNAGSAIEVGNLVLNIASFKAQGGAGGNGGEGPDGANGANGVNAGEAGSDGSYGGYGADGGNGGLGVWILDDYFIIYEKNNFSIEIKGGAGGSGGNGGKGGNGGAGAKGAIFNRGGNGGAGGNGGMGGDAGHGSVAIEEYNISKIIYFDVNGIETSLPSSIIELFEDGNDGVPGIGGSGGNGGAGGEPGLFSSKKGADGANGSAGADGT